MKPHPTDTGTKKAIHYLFWPAHAGFLPSATIVHLYTPLLLMSGVAGAYFKGPDPIP